MTERIDDKPKDAARQLRIEIARSLGIGRQYNRTHTPTGVFRRKDYSSHTAGSDEMVDAEESRRRARINERSLANLQKRRQRT